MRRSEARILSQAARRWQDRGLLQPGAYEVIQEDLRPDQEGLSLAMQAFYAIGGLMLGAATAALYALLRLNEVVSDQEESAWFYFFAWAVVLLMAGIGTHLARQAELGDAILIAALVPAAISLGPQAPDALLRLAAGAIGLGVAIWRRADRLVPTAGLALALVSWPLFLVDALSGSSDGDDVAMQAWLMGAVIAFAGVAAWHRFEELRWRDEAHSLVTANVAFAWLTVVLEVIQPSFDAGAEVLFGVGMLAVIGAGIALGQRTVIVGGAAALTVDAIVFAFDIGGPETGLAVLLAMAVGLIVTATWLRKRQRTPDGSNQESEHPGP